MPELGKYASDVLMAYGVGITILVCLIGLYALRSKRAKSQLAEVENRSL